MDFTVFTYKFLNFARTQLYYGPSHLETLPTGPPLSPAGTCGTGTRMSAYRPKILYPPGPPNFQMSVILKKKKL